MNNDTYAEMKKDCQRKKSDRDEKAKLANMSLTQMSEVVTERRRGGNTQRQRKHRWNQEKNECHEERPPVKSYKAYE